MKTAILWLVLYHAGEVGGVWGPLPYGMDECAQRRDTMNMEALRISATGFTRQGDPVPEKNRKELADFTFVCLQQSERPELGSPRP